MTFIPVVSQSFDPHSRLSDLFNTQYQNPAFDPRQYSTNPWYSGIQQGILLRTSANTPGGSVASASSGSNKVVNAQSAQVLNSVKLRFLYNPSDFSESMTPSDSLFPNVSGAGSQDPNDTSALIGQTQVTCSFNLLFDRTYEVNDSFNKRGDPNQFSHATGVMVDVITFKALLGIPLNGDGMPLFLPTYLFLGGVSSPAFYGVITNASIAYSHFSKSMVPLRAAISVSMTQWLDDSGGTSASSGTSTLSPLQVQAVSGLAPRTGAIPGLSAPGADPSLAEQFDPFRRALAGG